MRRVSKPWDFLLTQPSFIKSHLHRSINNLNDEIFLVLPDGYYEDVFSVTAHFLGSPHLNFPNFVKLPVTPSPRDQVAFFGSVNGLICFGFRTHDDDDFVVQIWNPSISTLLTVPPSDHNHDLDRLHFRFGYDPKTDYYKLVKLMSRCFVGMYNYVLVSRIFIGNAKDLVEGEVYSMRKGSWNLIENGLPSHLSMLIDEETVCVDGHDGHLHWLGYETRYGRPQMIVSFDLDVESFGEMGLPNSERFWDGLGVYSGKHCVMSFNKGYDYEVWVMNEYGVADSWVKMHVFSDSSGDMDPYGFTSNNKFLFRTLSDGLDFYDPSGGELVESIKIRGGDREEIKIVRYVDSLVWVAPAKHD